MSQNITMKELREIIEKEKHARFKSRKWVICHMLLRGLKRELIGPRLENGDFYYYAPTYETRYWEW